MSGRTSTRPIAGVGPARGDLGRPLVALALDHAVAGEVLLGLHERPVGHRRHAVADAHRPGGRRVGEALAADQLARRRQLLHDRAGLADDRVRSASGRASKAAGFW